MSETAILSHHTVETATGGAILIIDDEAAIRESLETLLEFEGYSVESAETGGQGLTKICERPVDLVLLEVARSRSTVLVQGESGTGKELIAKALHANSPRKNRPFVPVNTGSMPSDLLESTLFGHVKGAFTSAVASKKGLFEVADGGTIFLDEIGTMGLETQSKILRVLQDKKFMHLGGVQEIQVDVRVIAATNIDLKMLVREGRFREDLFYRLNVITVDLPPLRSRAGDIPLLVTHFLARFSAENGKPPRQLSPPPLRPFLDYVC